MRHSLLLTTAIIGLMLASGATAQTITLEQAAVMLGADTLSSIEYSGSSGAWYRFGQPPVPGKEGARHDVTAFITSIDFKAVAEKTAMARAETKTARQRPPLVQNVEDYVSGDFAWNLVATPGRPDAPRTPQPQPAEHDSRAIDIWASPQGFLKAALMHKAEQRPVKDGIGISFAIGASRYEGHVKTNGQVDRVRTWLPDPVLGDMEVAYQYSDYRDFSGTLFPARIVRLQGGLPVWELNVSAVKANIPVPISVPESVRTYKVPAPRTDILQLAEGVYAFQGANYNSVAIEQSNRIVIVEAPLNEARSLEVIAKIKALIPGKPIRYVINTHTHFDHSGGLRTYAAEGATIVTDAANRPFYEAAWRAPRTLQPDRLSRSKRKVTFETFTGKHVIADSLRPIEIFPVAGSGHADGFAMVYLPAEKFLIEADAFAMPPEGSRPPATPNPYNVNLYENIRRLNLDVRLLVPLHGPVGHIPDLRTAIGNAALTQPPKGCQQEVFYC